MFFVSIPLALAGLVVSFIAWCIATEHWQARVSLIGLLLSIIGLSLPLMVMLGIVLTGDPTAEIFEHPIRPMPPSHDAFVLTWTAVIIYSTDTWRHARRQMVVTIPE